MRPRSAFAFPFCLALAFFFACSSGSKDFEEDAGEIAGVEAGLATDDPNDPGVSKLVCDACIADETSPKGGWKECLTRSGAESRLGCVPPTPK